jgi:hypothetical protein
MGIKEFVEDFQAKRKEKKRVEKEMTEEDRIYTKIQEKKKSPMQRELERFQKQESEKKISDAVMKFRKQRHHEAMENSMINQKGIFNTPKESLLINAEPIFSKPRKSAVTDTGILFNERVKL